VLGYADRIATWYAQRLFASGKHPMARELWQLLADAAKAFREISDPRPATSVRALANRCEATGRTQQNARLSTRG
jgi:hypothetical protein